MRQSRAVGWHALPAQHDQGENREQPATEQQPAGRRHRELRTAELLAIVRLRQRNGVARREAVLYRVVELALDLRASGSRSQTELILNVCESHGGSFRVSVSRLTGD